MFSITLGLVPREAETTFLQAVCTGLINDEVVQEVRTKRHAGLDVDNVVYILYEQPEPILCL